MKVIYETKEELQFLQDLYHRAAMSYEDVLFNEHMLKENPQYVLIVINKYRQLNAYLGVPDHNQHFLASLERSIKVKG